jgi:hypothetical protein
MMETMRSKLKKDISDDAGEEEIKNFIHKKTESANQRLSILFLDEEVKVTSHVLRKIYFREAFLNLGLATGMLELAYACEIMGHDELSFGASATYLTVVFY